MSRPCVIVGGGLQGCAVAFALASRGVEVVVVERGVVGAEASTAAAGMLAPGAEALAHPGAPLALAIGRASLALYPAWLDAIAAASGIGVPLRLSGVLLEGRGAGDGPSVDDWTGDTRAGSPADDGRALDVDPRALEPSLAIPAARLFAGEGWVDPRVLVPAVHQAARRAGARFVRGEVLAVRAGEVTLGDGAAARLCGEVVICAGAWTARVPGLEALPVRPVRGQMLAVRPVGPAPSRVVFCGETEADRAYLVPRDDGRLLVGSTMEEVGFARGVTPEGVAAIQRAAGRVWPGLRDAPLLEAWSGFRPATPDGLPLLGPWRGLWIASGHHRNGILLAPWTAAILAGALLDGAMVDPGLAPGRFADQGAGVPVRSGQASPSVQRA